jgi:3-deoxy-D-manno-octulosonic-acid transferase
MSPAALRKMRKRGGKLGDLWQRLGYFKAPQIAAISALHEAGPVWWVHAVSVGEVGIARKMIEELFKQQPHIGVMLSTTTPTGFALANEFAAIMEQKVIPIYSALDGWFTVRRCLNLIRPVKIVLVEAEIWPNFLFAAKQLGIPTELVNARLSPRSERRYRKLQALIKPIFSMLAKVMVQEPEDVSRWSGIGVDPDRVLHTGSIKFDMKGQPEPAAKVAEFRQLLNRIGWNDDEQIMLAASTHDGEELEVGKLYIRLKRQIPNLFLIVVPRHVERATKVANDLSGLGIQTALRSAEATPETKVSALLVDTTGELRAWQYLASVVIIGKSFLAHGGQNPAEAVMAGKPVVFGPHMENFDALVRLLLERRGARQVQDFAEAEESILKLIQDKKKAQRVALAGQRALLAHSGATKRTVAELLRA